jgi:hypothetical protein
MLLLRDLLRLIPAPLRTTPHRPRALLLPSMTGIYPLSSYDQRTPIPLTTSPGRPSCPTPLSFRPLRASSRASTARRRTMPPKPRRRPARPGAPNTRWLRRLRSTLLPLPRSQPTTRASCSLQGSGARWCMPRPAFGRVGRRGTRAILGMCPCFRSPVACLYNPKSDRP